MYFTSKNFEEKKTGQAPLNFTSKSIESIRQNSNPTGYVAPRQGTYDPSVDAGIDLSKPTYPIYEPIQAPIQPKKPTNLKPSGSFMSNLGNAFVKGANTFNQEIINPAKNLLGLYNKGLSKVTGMNFDDTLLTKGVNGASNYYKNTSDDYNVDTSQSNPLAKGAYFLAGQAPSFIANAALMGIPLGKAGKVGEVLAKSSMPIGSAISNKIGGKVGEYAGNAVKEGLENSVFDFTRSALNGKDLKDSTIDAGKGFLGGAAFGTGLKGAGDLGRNLPKINGLGDLKTQSKLGAFTQKFGETSSTISKPIQEPIKGKFTVKNTALDKAQNAYDEAIQTIQNRFRTNQLTPEEMPLIKTELGIDIEKLANDLETAKTDIRPMGENARLSRVVGLNDVPVLNKNGATKLEPVLKPVQASKLGNTNTPLKGNNVTAPLKTTLKPLYAKGSGEFKTSELKTNTLKNSEFLQQPETQKIIDDIQAQYEVKPNAQSVDRATKELTNDFVGTMDRIKNTQALNSAEDTVSAGLITRQLRQEASTSGDYTKLKSWLEEIQPKVTETAQSLQALKTWQKLSPESALFKIQQVVAKVNREGEKEYGKKFVKVDFTPEEMKFVNDKMTEIEIMPETTPIEVREKDVEFAKVKQFAADKVPPTLAEKVQAIQRISLLLNPKTMGRNILGNVIMGGLENIKDIPASLVDNVASLKTGQRTTLAPSITGLKTQGKGLLTGLKNTISDARQGVDTNPSRGQYELPNKTIFKGKLGKLEKATSVGLSLGDRPFYQAAYDESLRQSMKIGKVTEPTKEMIESAVKMAEDRTYQNTTSLVEGFRKIQKGLNKLTGNENMGLGTVSIPFVKTPANILDKAIDYSPIGTIKGITQLMSKKTFDQKLFVDRIGRSITGSATIALGYELAKKGLVTGQSNKDLDMAALDRQAGKQPYAIKSGDTYHTIDWMQPSSIPLMIGADMFYGGKDKKAATNVIVDAVKSGGTTLFKQSLLQGVQKLFGGYDPISGVSSVVSGIPTQFLPGSLPKQIAQLTDSTVRDTYDPSKLKTIKNQIVSKIPGLSKTLPAKIDTMGREVKQFNGKNNLFNTFLNPGFTSTYKPSNAEKLATDTYNETGNKGVFPRVVNKSITYKEGKDNKTIQLTPKEKKEFQQYIGKETEIRFGKLNIHSNAEERAKALQKILSQIYTDGENNILRGRGLNVKK